MSIRGARLQFGGTPWARNALAVHRDRALALYAEAQRLGVSVGIVGKAQRGPWVVRVGTTRRTLRFAGDDIHATVAFGLDRWEAGADDSGIRWTAGRDGLAHGHRLERTLCGLPGIAEPFAHPELRRCVACWRTLDRAAVAA